MFPAVELPTPTSKQWIFREDFKELPGEKMLEFRLVYQGLLHGTDDSKHKHAIRHIPSSHVANQRFKLILTARLSIKQELKW